MRAAILAVCISLTAFAGGRGGGRGGFTNGSRGSISPSNAAPHQGHAYRGGAGGGSTHDNVFQGIGGSPAQVHATTGQPAAPVPGHGASQGHDGDRGQHHHHNGYGNGGYYGYGNGGYYGYGGYYDNGYGYGGYGYGGYGYGYVAPGYSYDPNGSYPSDYDFGSNQTGNSGGYQGQGGTYVDPNNPDDGELTGEAEAEPVDENAGPGQLFEVSHDQPAAAEPAPAAQAPAAQPQAAKPAHPEKEPDVFHWVDADGTDHYSTDLPADQRGKATKMAYDGSLLSWTPVTSAEADAAQGKPKQK